MRLAISLETVFEGGRVPEWLRQFERDPEGALTSLLASGADLGHLQAAEPSTLLWDWLELLRNTEFPQLLDETLAQWIRRYWGDPIPEFSGDSAEVTSAAWRAVCDLLWSTGAFPQAIQALREFFPVQRSFLRALGEGPSRDPEGRAWLALASHQQDRSLLPY